MKRIFAKSLSMFLSCSIGLLSTPAFSIATASESPTGSSVVENSIITAPYNIPVAPEGAMTVEDLPNCFSIAQQVLQRYYQAANCLTDADFSQFIVDENLSQYVETKLAIEQYPVEQLNMGIHNYQSDFQLLDWKTTSEDALLLDIGVRLTFSYANDTSKSGKGESVQLLFTKQNGNYRIVDWCANNLVDLECRGSADTQATALSAQSSSNHVLDRLEQHWEYVQTYIDGLLDGTNPELAGGASFSATTQGYSVSAVPSDTVLTAAKASVQSLDRFDMGYYAIENCDKVNPARGSAEAPDYYDFSKIAGNYDCTNFASHVLLSGGACMYKTSSSGTGWYYNGMGKGRSYSWSGVPYLYSFLVGNSTKGPFGTALAFSYPTMQNIPYYLGDIIQVAPANSSTFGHTVVVSSMYVSNPVVDPKICSRTSSTSYNKDIRFSHSPYAATNRQKRVVRLDGYYA